jgi:hypothetical protein
MMSRMYSCIPRYGALELRRAVQGFSGEVEGHRASTG